MNKSDLADPELIHLWCEHLEKQNSTKALPIIAHQSSGLNAIIPLIKKILADKAEKDKPINALITGIPNVGKSTVINGVSGRKVAKVGNEPAVTKRQQRIDLAEGIVLFDTPGILWPKIENHDSSFRLAISGAIKDTVLNYNELAFYLVDYLIKHYANELIDAYQLTDLDIDSKTIEDKATDEVVDLIGKRRGCLRAGGRIDLDKVCKIIIHDYRAGKLGRISLETPEMIEQELIITAERIRLKEEKKAKRNKK
jgi:ribosome biogenesis GTPase A